VNRGEQEKQGRGKWTREGEGLKGKKLGCKNELQSES
jgi:hypothetical protein